jgi:hypothetical protein
VARIGRRDIAECREALSDGGHGESPLQGEVRQGASEHGIGCKGLRSEERQRREGHKGLGAGIFKCSRPQSLETPGPAILQANRLSVIGKG